MQHISKNLMFLLPKIKFILHLIFRTPCRSDDTEAIQIPWTDIQEVRIVITKVKLIFLF
jgi:hypothetical protein